MIYTHYSVFIDTTKLYKQQINYIKSYKYVGVSKGNPHKKELEVKYEKIIRNENEKFWGIETQNMRE